MKKRPLVLILLLLLLLSLTPKDVTAVYGDESSESITSFSETLADDTLFYPDAFWNGTTGLADWGTAGPDSSENDYTYTHEGPLNEYKGFETTSGTSYIIINFTLPAQSTFESFDYAVYAAGANDDDEANLWVYDWIARDWDLIVNMPTLGQAAWYNGTGIAGPYSEDSQFSIMVNSTDADNPSECEIAIAHLTFYVMTLADSDHYAVSFAGDSDWTEYWFEAGDSSSTDGDVLSIEAAGDSAGDLDRFYTNDPSFTAEGYMEIRWRVNQTTIDYIYFVAWTQDTMSGSTTILSSAPPSDTSWHTQKLYISQAIECVELRISTTAGAKTKFDIDYLRIGPADAMGWQHDGSTTAGTNIPTQTDWTITPTTDNDKLTIVFNKTGADGDNYGNIRFKFDTTTTESDLELGYYPFFGISWEMTAISSGLVRVLPNVDSKETTGAERISKTATFESTIDRLNMAAASGSTSSVFIDVYYYSTTQYHGATVVIDWLKFYSIANFSVSINPNVANVLYVESGELVADTQVDAGAFTLAHDPAISVDISTYNVWNITSSTGLNPSAGVDFQFKPIVGASEETNNDETRGTYTGTGTATDFAIFFRTANLMKISAIKFIDTHDWQEINDVELVFRVPWGPEVQFGYDAFFIFLGLIMIPASTMYLARGGRKAMSMDKIFYGLVIFALGIGFLIGGILP